jgi:hypothetical protein
VGLTKKLIGLLALVVVLSSFNAVTTLKGTWEYAGDIFNGKKEGAPKEYALRREYSDTNFNAYVLEKGYEPAEYEMGTYKLAADTCLETQTWCGQPSKLLNITVHYHYTIRNDTLVLAGVLPTGQKTEEYWKRVEY